MGLGFPGISAYTLHVDRAFSFALA